TRQCDQDESAHVTGLRTEGCDPFVQAPAAEHEVRQGVVALIHQHPDRQHRDEIDDEHDQRRRGCGIHPICLLSKSTSGAIMPDRTAAVKDRRGRKTGFVRCVRAATIREWAISRFVVPTTRIRRWMRPARTCAGIRWRTTACCPYCTN